MNRNKEKPVISTIKNHSITKIFIVTPTFNSQATISRTIASVVSQSGTFDIYYHIQDGGSTDDTLSIIKKWDKLLTNDSYQIASNSVTLTYSSAPDEGMYDAIVKGFDIALPKEDGWLSWINSDDFYIQGAFSTIDKINKSSNLHKNIQWVTGASSINKETMQLFSSNRMLSKEIIKAGLADGKHWDFIQQEGTFFKRSLWNKINKTNGFANFKYAGDWNLWRQFSNYAEIYQFIYPLASFSLIEGQLSQVSRSEYEKETETIISKEERLSVFKDINPKNIKSFYLSASFENNHIKIETRSIVLYYNNRVDRLKLNDQYKIIDFPNPRETLIKQLNKDIEQQKKDIKQKNKDIEQKNKDIEQKNQKLTAIYTSKVYKFTLMLSKPYRLLKNIVKGDK